ncbi:MAG: RnfABCDGE type electron transport complex subunit D [Candidatus Micrarchaeota archaeon]|nr:RnfABCDGE type electron transport complex subunit D [Candidatus Micrarchaeota archaeon]
MKLGGHHIAMMHLVALILLVALAAYGAYASRVFPVSLIVAVVSCCLIDMAIGFYHKKGQRVPWSALITGVIIGSVAPIAAPVLLVVVASLVAELTKHFLKMRSRHFLNPAVAGLLVALPAFGAGDEW